jgi:hypothetical protein
MNRCVTTIIAAAVGLAASGCANSGELGHGYFDYVCVSDADLSCNQFYMPSIEGTVAVGGRFELTYSRDRFDDAAQGALAGVEPASTEVVEQLTDPAEGTGMRFLVPGEAAFLARSTHGEVIDFIHLHADEVQDIQLTRASGAIESMGMLQGDTDSLTAYPLGFGGEPLIGSLRCTWQSNNPDVIAAPETDSCRIDIQALAPGETILEVQMGPEVRGEIAITVDGTVGGDS